MEKDILVEISEQVYTQKPKDINNQWQVVQKDYYGNGELHSIVENDITGFGAMAYVNEQTKEVVITYRGTNDIEDSSFNNLNIAIGKIPNQYAEASYFYEMIKDDYKDYNITITGHSLGGALAQLVGVETNTTTVAFNSPGVLHLLEQINPNLSLDPKVYSNITTYNTSHDILHMVNIAYGLTQLGENYIVLDEMPNLINSHLNFNSLKTDISIPYLRWVYENQYLVKILMKIEKTKLKKDVENLLIKLSKLIDKNYGGFNILYIENAKESYTQAQSAARKVDPLLVDLDGDGIETTSIKNGIFFDHANDGFEEISAWVGEDDGIIVVDKNNNGIIDNGTELLGDNYLKTNGNKATSGFDALKDFDSNGDKVINNKDANFNQLKVLKGDGTLLSLEEAGIASISLSTSTKKVTDENGNTQLIKGSYTKADGTKADIADYSFVLDTINSIATEWIEETEEIASLPDIQGVGTVYSLHQAILRDESGELKQLVQQFLNDSSVDNTTTKRELVKQILYKWTGADSVEDGSRGVNFGAKELHVIEQFMGERGKIYG